jgi:DNA helicase HerA-like ATPase
LSKEELIRWVKEGRQPGLSLVVATQQPSAIDSEVLSQCDVILSHALTTRDDKTALNRLTKDYMRNEIKTYINQIARTGQAVFVDDDAENIDMTQIRPRVSKPGGSEG